MRALAAAAALLVAAAPAWAPAWAADPATVTTHATARDRLPNTVADVQVSIESRAKTLAEVRAALSTASPPLLAYLGETGAQRVRTESVDVRPELDTSVPGRPPRVTGYLGRLSTTFQLEAGRLGGVLGEVLSHGANTIDTATLHPRQTEIDAARDRLAAAATRLALSQAKAVAEAAGRAVGPIRSIQVEDSAGGFRRMGGQPPVLAAMAVAAPVATEAGDTEITATVTATITLADP